MMDYRLKSLRKIQRGGGKMGLEIIGEATPFRDRIHAAELLLRALQEHGPENPLVLGIPRGGVVLGAKVSEGLGADLDVVIARKLGAPHNPELAIGAVMEGGEAVLNDSLVQALGVSDDYVRSESERQSREIRQRTERYRAVQPCIPRTGRNLIVVDDGVATGATMKATLHGLRAAGPALLWCALAVGPEDTLQELAEIADEVLCLAAPRFFQAVGQFYEEFTQTADEEVIACLRAAHSRRATKENDG
jgi:predicted phosphoribosyltransferase